MSKCLGYHILSLKCIQQEYPLHSPVSGLNKLHISMYIVNNISHCSLKKKIPEPKLHVIILTQVSKTT